MPSLSRYSRYQSTKRVIDFRSALRYIEWNAPRFGEVPERIYVVTERDVDRPDLISWESYGTVDLWWLVLFYNTINDPYSLQPGDRLKIPAIDIPGVGGIGELRDLANQELPTVPTILAYRPPRFRRVLTGSTAPETVEEIRDPLFNFGFPVPETVDGIAHFQLQIASDGDFSDILISRMTQTSVERWFYYDHLANNGVGGHAAFPPQGLDADIYQGQSVYHLLRVGELVGGNTYYFRYRAWVDNIESAWYAPPPILI